MDEDSITDHAKVLVDHVTALIDELTGMLNQLTLIQKKEAIYSGTEI